VSTPCTPATSSSTPRLTIGGIVSGAVHGVPATALRLLGVDPSVEQPL